MNLVRAAAEERSKEQHRMIAGRTRKQAEEADRRAEGGVDDVKGAGRETPDTSNIIPQRLLCCTGSNFCHFARRASAFSSARLQTRRCTRCASFVYLEARPSCPTDAMRLVQATGPAKAYDISGKPPPSLSASLTTGPLSTSLETRSRHRAELSQNPVDLLHDFQFPSISTQVLSTPDSSYILAAGEYPPQVHVYETSQLSLKFSRNLSSSIIRFCLLGEDWRKLAFLCNDRHVEFHAQFGMYYRLRIPKLGRDLSVDRGSCDLYVGGVGSEIWRLNLEMGRFLKGFDYGEGEAGGVGIGEGEGVNCVEVAKEGRLVASGGSDGVVRVWDPRMEERKMAGVMDVGECLVGMGKVGVEEMEEGVEITSLDWGRGGIHMAVGTSTGQSLLLDVRSNRPQVVKEQGYGLPIVGLNIHENGEHVLSADKKCIKAWDRRDGKNFAVIEPDVDINGLCVLGRSGVMCCSAEAMRVQSYYVPALGPAPKWCAHLDSVTEELEDERATGRATEESESVMYENYKFVTRNDLEDVGLLHLIGTDLARPYMHGFFINLKLYRRAVDAAQPFAYEKYKREQAQKKIEAERESRIGKVRKRLQKKPKVNSKLAEMLLERAQRKNKDASSVLEDDRFKMMFEDERFAVDEEADRFKILNPNLSSSKHRKQMEEAAESDSEEERRKMAKHKSAIEEKEDESSEEESSDDDSSSGSSSESDEESDGGGVGKVRRNKDKSNAGKQRRRKKR